LSSLKGTLLKAMVSFAASPSCDGLLGVAAFFGNIVLYSGDSTIGIKDKGITIEREALSVPELLSVNFVMTNSFDTTVKMLPLLLPF
jgi:hypothetical protein